MPRVERTLIGIQPILFGLAGVLFHFVSLTADPKALVRPLLVTFAISLVITAIALITARSWIWAGILAGLFITLTFRLALPAGVLAAISVWWVLVLLLRRATGRRRPPNRIPRLVATGTGAYSAVFLASMVWTSWSAVSNTPPRMNLPEYVVNGSGGPNIFFLLLDGYPRADTLRETFGIENEPFLDDLEAEGFEISEGARPNYNKTWLTLASALNGGYVSDLLGDQQVPPDDSSQIRWLHSLIHEASILEIPRQRGYAIRTVPSPFTSAALTSADDYIDKGYLTEFESKIIWSTPWALILRGPVSAALLDNQKRLVIGALETTADLAEAGSEQPQFVFTHIQSPHTPFVLHPAGTPAPTAFDCFPFTCSLWQATIEELAISRTQYRAGLQMQLETLNTLVLSAVKRITAADPEAIIILMSDHGARYSLQDTSEHFRSFLATRTPGAPGLFPDDESPVNVFRRLFDQYFEADTAPLPYRAWLSDWDFTLRLTEIQPGP